MRADFLTKSKTRSKERTLLQSFINNEIAEYREPQRQGTPKGEPIGFLNDKYKASLYMLKGIGQKNIAEQLGKSHELLRKWNSEDEFKKKVEEHRYKFVSMHLDNIKLRLKRKKELYDKVLQKPTKDIGSMKSDKWGLGLDEYRDIRDYRFDVKRELAQAFADAIKTADTTKADYLDFVLEVYRILNLIWSRKIEVNKEVKQHKKIVREKLKRLVSKRLEDTLLKLKIKGKDKKEVLDALSFIEMV